MNNQVPAGPPSIQVPAVLQNIQLPTFLKRPWITVILIALILAYLYVRPVSLPCIGCSQPSWWYKCTDENLPEVVQTEITRVCNNYACIKKCGLSSNIDVIELVKKSGILGLVWNELKDIPVELLGLLKAIEVDFGHVAQSILNTLTPIYEKVKDGILTMIEKTKTVAVQTWADFLTYVINPIVSAVIENIYTPIVPIISNLLTFKNTLVENMKKAWEALQGLPLNDIIEKIKGAFTLIGETIDKLSSMLVNALNTVMTTIVGGLNTGLSDTTTFTQNAVNNIVNVAENAANEFIKTIKTVIEGSEGVIDNMATVTQTVVTDIVNGINKDIIGNIEKDTNTMLSGINSFVDSSKKVINDTAQMTDKVVGDVISGINNTVINGVEDAIDTTVNGIEGAINTGIGDINKGVGVLTDAFNVVGNGIDTALRDVVSALNVPIGGFIDEWNKVRNTNIDLTIPPIDFGKLGTFKFPDADVKPFEFLGTIDKSKALIPNASVCPPGGCNYSANIPLIRIPSPERFEYPIQEGFTLNIPKIPPAKVCTSKIPGQCVDLGDANIPRSISIPKIPPAKICTSSDPSKCVSFSPVTINPVKLARVTIPIPSIPPPPTLTTNDFKMNLDPFKPLIQPIADTRQAIKDIIALISAPIDSLIQEIVKFVATISGAIKTFITKYINWAYIKEQFDAVIKNTRAGYDEIVAFARTNILGPLTTFAGNAKDIFVTFLKDFANEALTSLKDFTKTLSGIFSKIFSAVRIVATSGVKIAVAGAAYSATIALDVATPWWYAQPITKFVIVLLIAAFIFIGPYINSAGQAGRLITNTGTDIVSAFFQLPISVRIAIGVGIVGLIAYNRYSEPELICDCNQL
jgi:phage-related protein